MAKLDIYMPQRQRIVIHGQVQQIGFRLWLRNVANSLALVGSCRLLDDDTCEVIVQGEKTLVKQFVVACKRGPAEATVERIDSEILPVDPSIGSFAVDKHRPHNSRITHR